MNEVERIKAILEALRIKAAELWVLECFAAYDETVNRIREMESKLAELCGG